MTANILNGTAIAQQIKNNLKEKIQNKNIGLAVLLANKDPSSISYVNNKIKACKDVGINSYLIDNIHSEKEMVSKIYDLNTDRTIHGILVQLPLPKEIHQYRVLDSINPLKDVDVFHPVNVGLLSQNRPRFYPCTPYGIHEMLRISGISIEGKKVVIINSSNIVGKPLNKLWIDQGATVTVCHDRTPSKMLKEVCLYADIIVVAVGIPKFLTSDMVKPGAVVIDVGITRIGNKIVGDVDFESVREIAGWISPVPGGVGPLTVAMLLHNTILAYELLSKATIPSYNEMEPKWLNSIP